MSDDRRCVDGGYLGGIHLAIPAEPSQYRRDFNDRIGCNQLRCSACSSMVRHLDGYRIQGYLNPAAKADLYDSAAPETTKYVYSDPATREGRVYFCRCTAHTEFGLQSADSTDFGWSCAGHP